VKAGFFAILAALFLTGRVGPPWAGPPPMTWSTNATPLFNGRDLSNWEVTDFVARGPVTVVSNIIVMGAGGIMTGINWTNGPLPTNNYEISLDAMRSDGSDFFCGLTFPVGESFCSLILGGWGGSMTGLSSLDDLDASENETSKSLFYEMGRWYHVRLQVTPAKITTWLDQDKIIDAKIAGRKISLRPGPIEFSRPLGLATYQTGAKIKNLQLRLIEP
jgi:hypothetical protein